MIKTWRLDDLRQTLVLGSREERLAQILYWGPPLPASENLQTLVQADARDLTGGMLDENPALSICPEARRGFPGQAGLVAEDAQGKALLPLFIFESAEETVNALVLTYRDDALQLTYQAQFDLDPETHVISVKASLSSVDPVKLTWFVAPVFPAPQGSQEMTDFAGRWCGEFQMNTTAWSAGIRERENHTGRTGHEHFPGLLVPMKGARNTQGHVYGFHYGWSGGHRMVAEELPDGRRQIQFGHVRGIERTPQTRFETAVLYASFSDEGSNGCAVAFQRHLRDRVLDLPDPSRPRPVHYNCWEAVYFDHKPEELKDIATLAASLGAERFVLDDGWFGQRDDDTQSLSDWQVDLRKYPEGLSPLIDHVHDQGMSFGIWFEPEMINQNSDTYRLHPEWVLGPKDQILGRQQMVLNMALPDVQSYLFDAIARILNTYDIDYIKWDHNRVLPFADAGQTRGRTHRVWLSDSNDALERLKMQHNAALFLPSVVTGSHVGPRKCHTSGRSIDIRFRAWVAAQRHMGFEMDPRELSEEESEVLRTITGWWKENRHWMAKADILRLDSADPAVIAEQQLSECATEFVVFAGQAQSSSQILPRPLPLTRLDPDARYRIELVNAEELPKLSRGGQGIKAGPLELSGAYLMAQGLNLPWRFPETMWVVKGTKL
jgi:alpha-galactosidase